MTKQRNQKVFYSELVKQIKIDKESDVETIATRMVENIAITSESIKGQSGECVIFLFKTEDAFVNDDIVNKINNMLSNVFQSCNVDVRYKKEVNNAVYEVCFTP